MSPRTQAEVFIDEILDSKLESEGFRDTPRPLHQGRNFLLMKRVSFISFQPGPESYIQSTDVAAHLR
jgi:hypothetical protein